jgi:hypothetical protein
MAEEKKAKGVLAKLTPNTILVPIDGKDIRVPMNKFEAALMNNILVSQMREMIQEQIIKYKDGEQVLTPRELRELAGAIKETNEASDAIFEKIDLMDIDKPKEKAAEKQDDSIDFGKLEDESKNEQP